MSRHIFGNFAGEAFELLIGGEKLQIRDGRLLGLTCFSHLFCGSFSRRQHALSIGQFWKNVNHAAIGGESIPA